MYESNFCKAAEYQKSLPDRIREDQATDGSLYMGMFILEDNPHGVEAAKLPLKVINSCPAEIGGRILYLAFLNNDLQPTHKQSFTVRDGIMIDTLGRFQITNTVSKIQHAALNGYMKKYGDEIDDSLNEILASTHAPKKELVMA